MDLGLKGKAALVTGASRGIGRGIALELAREGCRVALCARGKEALDAAAAEVRALGVQTVATAADVTTAAGVQQAFDAATAAFGAVDILVNNVGGSTGSSFLETGDADWQRAIDLNLWPAVRLSRLVVPSMRARGGGAILVGTSSTVKEPFPNLALSNVMRAGVTALVKTLALELAPDQIRVNSLLPGRIATDRLNYLDQANATKAGITADEQRQRAMATIPAGRYGEPDEFGRAGAFLLSNAASYITGAALQVDGGLLRGLL